MKKADMTERLMTLFDKMTEEQKDDLISYARKQLDEENGVTGEPKEAQGHNI